MAAAVATAVGCSAEINQEEIRISDYKDGKTCAVSLTFDDGMKEHYTIVAPELEKRGFRGTFWLNGAWIQDAPQIDTTHLTWTEVAQMHENGHEMSNHSWSHPNLAEISEEEVLSEIVKNDDAIEKHTGVRPTTFCFPYNVFNDEIVAMALDGKVGARLDQFWLGGQHSPKEYLEQQIADALTKGSWISGMTHGINYGYDCYENPSEFTDFLDYLKSFENDIWVAPFREVAVYRKAAEETALTIEKTGNGLLITPVLDLDRKLYDGLLTLEIPSAGRNIKAEQNNASLNITVKGDKAYIDFNPFDGPVKIS